MLIEEMQKLKDAFKQIADIVQNAGESTLNAFADCFPFKNSIEDTAYDVGNWVDDFIDAMN